MNNQFEEKLNELIEVAKQEDEKEAVCILLSLAGAMQMNAQRLLADHVMILTKELHRAALGVIEDKKASNN